MPARSARLVGAFAQAAVHGVRGLRRVGAPGEVERGQQPGVQALDPRARAREVHEHEPLVGLGVAVLRPGGDAEVLDLDREHQLGQRAGREVVAVQRAQGAHAAVTIALDPPRPTSRGTVVDQRTAHGPRP